MHPAEYARYLRSSISFLQITGPMYDIEYYTEYYIEYWAYVQMIFQGNDQQFYRGIVIRAFNPLWDLSSHA